MASRPDLTAVVQQALSDLTPGRVRAIKFHGVETLDLDGAPAAGAVDPQQFARDLRQPSLLERKPWLSVRAQGVGWAEGNADADRRKKQAKETAAKKLAGRSQRKSA